MSNHEKNGSEEYGMLKILHTGDIHLDSPFARLDEKRARTRREELRAAFSAMIAYARGSAVDMVLMSGDIFDSEYVNRQTEEILVRELSRLSCPVIIAPGNHDFASPDSIWMRNIFPDNVYIFRSPEITRFSFDNLNTDVYGYAFTSPEMTVSPLCGQRVQDPSRINLLCAHADTSSPLSRYAPVTRADLAAFGADYAALGHIHNPGTIECRDGTVSAYCGCLEGRAPDESGPKGAVIAEIAKEGIRATVRAGRIRFSRRRYENAVADCSGAITLGDIEASVHKAITGGGYGEDTLLRLTLSGSGDPSLIVDTAALSERFHEVFSLELTDNTLPALRAEDFENDRTVRGEFYRTLLPMIENGTPRERRIAAAALRRGLAAMSGDN